MKDYYRWLKKDELCRSPNSGKALYLKKLEQLLEGWGEGAHLK